MAKFIKTGEDWFVEIRPDPAPGLPVNVTLIWVRRRFLSNEWRDFGQKIFGNFGHKSKFGQISKFWSQIEIWSNIEILVKHRTFVKNRDFGHQSKVFKHRNFGRKSKVCQI